MANLQKSLQTLKRPINIVYPGSLGASPSVVNVPNRLGFSYVRLLGNTSELIQAYNTTVAAQYDVPVQVQWDGKKYVVIGRDINRYASWNASAYLPTHGDTHQFGGGDTTWVLQEQFYPLSVSPSGTSLYIAPYVYNWNGVWKTAGGVTVAGITLPSDPTKQKIMLLYMDGASATPAWLAGTEAPLYTNKNLLIPYLPSFNPAVGMPLAMVRIPSGTTALGWSNLYDVRPFFGAGSVSGSSSTGSNYVLPTASASILGGVKIGSRLTMTGDTLSADVQSGSGTSYSLPTGSTSILGGFRVGVGLSVYPDGTLNVTGTSSPTGTAHLYIDQAGGSGTNTYGAISGSRNGINLLFGVSQGQYTSGDLLVYMNGQLLAQLDDWHETNPSLGTFSFVVAPGSTDIITAVYGSLATGGGSGGGPPGFQNLSDGPTISWDLALGNAKVTLGGDRTLSNPSSMALGEHYFLEVIQGSGSNHLAYGSNYWFPNYVTPILSTSAGAIDVLVFECDGTRLLFTGIAKNLVNTGTALEYVNNLSTWLEARLQSYSDAGSTPCVDNDPVYVTIDQSGNGINALQTTLANRPVFKTSILNGHAVWRFDGTNSLYFILNSLSPGNSVSFFLVIIPTTTTPIGLLDGSVGESAFIRNYPAGLWYWDGNPNVSFTTAATTPVLLEFVHSQNGLGRTLKFYVNGTLIDIETDPSTNSIAWNNPILGTISLGSDGKYSGDMAAFLCYQEAISDTNRTLVEAYLKTVYGIT